MADIAAPGVALSTAPATAAVCPYLLGTDGAWRAATASRDHRCNAVSPAAPLTTDKQRRLCLVAEHLGCSTYNAAITALAEAGSVDDRPLHRPITRTAPLVLDRGRIAVGRIGLSMPGLPERGIGQGGLVALMAVAFGAIAITRLGGGPELRPTAVEPGPTRAPAAIVTPAPEAVPTAVPTLEPTLVPSGAEPTPTTPAKTPAPPAKTPKPAPPDATTYKVQSGDTLSGIAAEHGTTWQELARINRLSDPRRLKVGQVLELP